MPFFVVPRKEITHTTGQNAFLCENMTEIIKVISCVFLTFFFVDLFVFKSSHVSGAVVFMPVTSI